MFCIVSVAIPQNNELLKLKISLGFILVVVDDNRIPQCVGKYELLSVSTTLNHHNVCILYRVTYSKEKNFQFACFSLISIEVAENK